MGPFHQRGARIAIVTVLAAVFAWLAAPSALAQSAPRDPSAQAAELKQRGDEAMRKLRYAEALDLYDRSYDLDPNPALFYNRGRALEALDRFPEALEQFEEFVRTAPEELKAKAPGLADLIRELEGKVTELTVTANVKGARVLLRNRLLGRTPLANLRVNAGRAVVELSAEGYKTLRIEANLPGGREHQIDARLTPKATTGLLIITSTIAGATVHIDGTRIGTVPAEKRVEQGRHVIRVSAEGFETAETVAVVAPAERKRVNIALEETKPVTQKWWFWTGIGVVVAGAATTATIIALTTEKDPGSGTLDPGQIPVSLVQF